MPLCATKFFGDLEVPEDAVLTLPNGILGFEHQTNFVVIQRPGEYPLVYLQSASEPQLCFLALPVLTVDAGYVLVLNPEDASKLGLPAKPAIGADVLCLVLITVHEQNPTANLLAPIVVNLKTRTGRQCINEAAGYSHQESLGAYEGAAA